MANRIQIELYASDKTGRTLQDVGQKMQNIGQGLSSALSRPLADLGRMILKNEEVEKSLEPIKAAWQDVFNKLSESIIPVIQDLTPALITLAGTVTNLINQFNQLDPGVKDAIVGFITVVAAIGPVITFVGSLVTTIGGLTSAWASVSAILSPLAATVLPAVGAALAAISAPVWLLIGAIALLGATIAIFGKDAWNTVTMIVKIFDVLIQRIKDAISQMSLFNGQDTSMANTWTGSNFGGRAVGGPVLSGTPYIVGERGPELFIPSSSGQIVPNNKLGSGSASGMNIVINYSPVASFATTEELKRNLVPLVRQALRSA